MFKMLMLEDAPRTQMPDGRGEVLHLVGARTGAEALDMHINRLFPGGPRGRLHRHSQADNVYLVRTGTAELHIAGEVHTVRPDQVIYIPAGVKHSLSNISDELFEVLEIYAPAGDRFDFIIED